MIGDVGTYTDLRIYIAPALPLGLYMWTSDYLRPPHRSRCVDFILGMPYQVGIRGDVIDFPNIARPK